MVDNCLELKRYSSCFCVMRNELYAWCVASFAVGRVTDTHRPIEALVNHTARHIKPGSPMQGMSHFVAMVHSRVK